MAQAGSPRRLNISVLFFLFCGLVLSSCSSVPSSSTSGSSFGGHCNVILSRLDSATEEVLLANGMRERLRQVADDFRNYQSDIVDADELDLIDSLQINAAWLVDYWDYPDKPRAYTVREVSADFIDDTKNPLLARCK